MTGKPEESLERLSRLMVEMTDVARLLQKALDTGHAQGLLYDSVLPCMKELTTLVPALLSDRDKLAAEVERLNKVASNGMTTLDLMVGWNAANKRAEAAESKLSALSEVVRQCKRQFEFYVEQHMGKQPPDAAKGKINEQFADLCHEALASLHSAVPAEGEGRPAPVCVLCGAPNADPRPWDPREPVCPDCQDRKRAIALPAEEEGKAFQARVQPWMLACFGQETSDDRQERGDRLLEEVLELLQSGGYDPARVLPLRDYTWGRPAGEPSQEVGGVMVTLAAYCLAHRLDMHEAGETELARINQPDIIAKIRTKQAAKPTGFALLVATHSQEPQDARREWYARIICEAACEGMFDAKERVEATWRHWLPTADAILNSEGAAS